MKKTFIILISLFMILSLSACSDDRKKEETVEEEAAAEETENADMENENSEMEGKILVVFLLLVGESRQDGPLGCRRNRRRSLSCNTV